MPDRYEREIDDLLHHLNRRRRESVGERLARKLRPYSDGFQRALAAFLHRPPTEQFMIAAMLLIVISFAMGNFLGMEKWAGYLSVLSLVLFLIGIALSVAGRHRSEEHT